jgi:hypothetical protein
LSFYSAIFAFSGVGSDIGWPRLRNSGQTHGEKKGCLQLHIAASKGNIATAATKESSIPELVSICDGRFVSTLAVSTICSRKQGF